MVLVALLEFGRIVFWSTLLYFALMSYLILPSDAMQEKLDKLEKRLCDLQENLEAYVLREKKACWKQG